MKTKPYKIFLRTPWIDTFFLTIYSDFFVETKNKEEADICFVEYDPKQDVKAEPKTVYVLNFNRKLTPRKNIRTSNAVDQHYIEGMTFDGIVFCKTFDLYADNFINGPLPHMRYENISKDKEFFRVIDESPFKHYNKCVWKARVGTHITRKTAIDYLNNKNDKRLELTCWTPESGMPYSWKNHGTKPTQEWEYDNYFDELSKSDLGLVIRGDRPWLFSFWDVVRAGSIPVCINTQYHNLGWEDIGYDPNDLFLSYDLTKNDTLGDVYEGIDKLLKNPDKCIQMKKNMRKFYKEIYLTDRSHKQKNVAPWLNGFTDFYAAKIIEIIENGFKLKSNKLFCNKIFDIKQ